MIPAEAAYLDAEDPLAFTRERFRIPDGVIYLDGNSLGAMPAAAPERLARAVGHEWGERLIASWNEAGWIDLPKRLGGKIATLVGAEPGSVVVTDSTSVNLFKAVAGALRLRPERRVIVSEAGDFPTDAYVLEGLAALSGCRLRLVARDEIAGALTDEVAVLALSHVHYRSGAVHDMAAISAPAHAVGALAVWDLSHSAGALTVQLAADGADFAVGCGYKYLNGGPGAPAFLYVAPRHQGDFANPLSGWFGHAAPFAFEQGYRPAEGATRALTGTPPVLSMTALEQGLATFDGVDLGALREKAKRLSQAFLQGAMALGLEPACPLDGDARGNQASFHHPHAYALVQALIADGVVGDFREPDIARFGFAPLYLSYADIAEALTRLETILVKERWRHASFQVRLPVT